VVERDSIKNLLDSLTTAQTVYAVHTNVRDLVMMVDKLSLWDVPSVFAEKARFGFCKAFMSTFCHNHVHQLLPPCAGGFFSFSKNCKNQKKKFFGAHKIP